MKKLLLLIPFWMLFFNGTSQTPLTNAEDFTVIDMDGNEHQLFNYLDSGKFVLLEFFFTT